MVSPKYARVQNGIVSLIATRNIKKGEMLPTEKQLAACFQVSIITIRRAVKHLEESNIVRREQGRGTFLIADIQGRVDNGTIVYLNIMRGELSFPAFAPSMKDMDSGLSRRGYRLSFLIAGQEPDAEAICSLKDVRGVVATGWINAKWVQMLNALDLPVVFLGGITCDPLEIPMVSFDYRRMAAMLAEHLMANGARKIGLILGGSDYAPSALMREGLASVMERCGERLEPSMIYYSDDERPMASSNGIREFLDGLPDVDGFLIELGCYVHVINNLLNSPRRPLLGVMSDKPRFGNVCQNVCEAAFKDDIYEKAIELLLERIQSGRRSVVDIKLEPYLVA